MPRQSSRVLTLEDAARIKGMLKRGDVQSDIAQYHGVNQGRIIEAKKGYRWERVPAMAPELLPPPGPYVVITRVAHERYTVAELALREMVAKLEGMLAAVRKELKHVEDIRHGST